MIRVMTLTGVLVFGLANAGHAQLPVQEACPAPEHDRRAVADLVGECAEILTPPIVDPARATIPDLARLLIWAERRRRCDARWSAHHAAQRQAMLDHQFCLLRWELRQLRRLP